MTAAHTDRVRLEYETFGEKGKPVILLVMGFSAQMVLWPEWFCNALARHGYFVVRFDNRDVGLSQKFDVLGRPDATKLLARRVLGMKVPAPYTLEDLAADAVSLLDSLNIQSAHVVGMSMGGMIAQLIAINYPDRVRSLTSWASSTGKLHHLLLPLDVTKMMLTPPPTDIEGRVRAAVEFVRLVGSPAFPTPVEKTRQRTRAHLNRSMYTEGNTRQFAAVVAARDRSKQLARLDVPALVIHGDCDRLVPLRAGKDTAKAIPGAKLKVIEGYGHDLPDQVLPRIVEFIRSHVLRAEELRRSK